MVRELPTTATFAYAQVEAALAKLYEAQEVQRTAFRGRLKHFNFRKLGIPQQQPGKGSRIRYTTVLDIFQLTLACEFSEFGIDPHLIANILRRLWRSTSVDLTQRFPGDDFLVVVEPHFMSWTWNRKKYKRTAKEISVSVVGEPVSIHYFKARESQISLNELQKTARRFFVFNLSARVRDVEKALTEQKMK